MANEARPKVWAALLVEVKILKSVITPVSSTPSSGAMSSSMKREPVSMPKFAGSEKPGCSPFLDYPIWQTNWNQHIIDYEEKSWSNLLLSHLDKEAQRRIVGDENNYVKAMEKLDKYYGDKRKVVLDCMTEITNFGKVPHNDFKQLIALKT